MNMPISAWRHPVTFSDFQAGSAARVFTIFGKVLLYKAECLLRFVYPALCVSRHKSILLHKCFEKDIHFAMDLLNGNRKIMFIMKILLVCTIFP